VTRQPGWLARTWIETSPGLRSACLIMWAGGLIGSVLGTLGDLLGWWYAWPFLTNLASSLVGALFGVPIALIVLQRIAATETHRQTRREVVRLARITVDELRDELTGLSPDLGLLSRLTNDLRVLTDDLVPSTSRCRYGPELEKVLSAWCEVHATWPCALVDEATAAGILARASVQWRYFRDHIGQGLRQYRAWPGGPAVEATGRLIAVAPVHYRARREMDDDLAAAARLALSARSVDPLVRLYGGGDAVLAGVADHIEEVAVGVHTTADLITAVNELATEIWADDRPVP
jgi:hypothetical protein